MRHMQVRRYKYREIQVRGVELSQSNRPQRRATASFHFRFCTVLYISNTQDIACGLSTSDWILRLISSTWFHSASDHCSFASTQPLTILLMSTNAPADLLILSSRICWLRSCTSRRLYFSTSNAYFSRISSLHSRRFCDVMALPGSLATVSV